MLKLSALALASLSLAESRKLLQGPVAQTAEQFQQQEAQLLAQQQQLATDQSSTEALISQLKADGEVLAWAPWPADAWPGTQGPSGAPVTKAALRAQVAATNAEMTPAQRSQAAQLGNQNFQVLKQQSAQNLQDDQQQAQVMLQQFAAEEQAAAPAQTGPQAQAPAPIQASELAAIVPPGAAASLEQQVQHTSEDVQAEISAATNAASAVSQALENTPASPPPTVVALLQGLPPQQASNLAALIQSQQQTTVNMLESDLAADQNEAPAPGQAPVLSSTDGLTSSEAAWISSEAGAPATAVLGELTPEQVQALTTNAKAQAQQLQAFEQQAESAAAAQAPAPAPSSEGNYGGLGATEWSDIQGVFKSENEPVPTVQAFEANLTPQQLQQLQQLASQTAQDKQQLAAQEAQLEQQFSTSSSSSSSTANQN